MFLSMFDCSNKMRDAFINAGFPCLSLDIHPGYNGSKTDIVTDILEWDYKTYSPGYFTFMFIALPCQAYSIASGGFHFKKGIPVTAVALDSIEILKTVHQITQYFNCKFIIENPSGGLCNNSLFRQLFNVQVTRLSQSSFGFPTQKKTDLFYNFNMLLLVPQTHRINGKYATRSLDSLSYRQRVTYPDHFCKWLVAQYLAYIQN